MIVNSINDFRAYREFTDLLIVFVTEELIEVETEKRTILIFMDNDFIPFFYNQGSLDGYGGSAIAQCTDRAYMVSSFHLEIPVMEEFESLLSLTQFLIGNCSEQGKKVSLYLPQGIKEKNLPLNRNYVIFDPCDYHTQAILSSLVTNCN